MWWYTFHMGKKHQSTKPKNKKNEVFDDDCALCRMMAEEEGNDSGVSEALSEAEMKKRLDCTWKRIPCGEEECPICGPIKRERGKMILEGKNPDTPEAAFGIVGTNVAEALTIIKEDAKRMGIDIENLDDIPELPEPKDFPLAQSAEEWCVELLQFCEKEDAREALWLMTEEAEDLAWYASVFAEKVYRQLQTRWSQDRALEYGDFDYEYTRDVLKQIGKILTATFRKLEISAPALGDFHKKFVKLYGQAVKI